MKEEAAARMAAAPAAATLAAASAAAAGGYRAGDVVFFTGQGRNVTAGHSVANGDEGVSFFSVPC